MENYKRDNLQGTQLVLGKGIKTKKLIIQIPIREINNELIKP